MVECFDDFRVMVGCFGTTDPVRGDRGAIEGSVHVYPGSVGKRQPYHHGRAEGVAGQDGRLPVHGSYSCRRDPLRCKPLFFWSEFRYVLRILELSERYEHVEKICPMRGAYFRSFFCFYAFLLLYCFVAGWLCSLFVLGGA